MRDYAKTAEMIRVCSLKKRIFCSGCVKEDGDDGYHCAIDDAADAIEELLAKVPTWHPVSEKPTRKNPTHARDTFLVRLESGCIKTLTYEYDNSDRCRPGMSPLFDEGWAKTVVPVTHWMELPKFEPPKGVE